MANVICTDIRVAPARPMIITPILSFSMYVDVKRAVQRAYYLLTCGYSKQWRLLLYYEYDLGSKCQCDLCTWHVMYTDDVL